MFQCESTERRRAILDRFTTFDSHFTEMRTAEPIIRALQQGAIAWIEGSQCPTSDTLMLPDNALGKLVAQAYEEQTELGWNVLFRGFWTTTWQAAQEEAYKSMRNRTIHDTSERWATKAQLWYYALFEHIWGLRNADEHGADIDTQRVIRLSKCERAIRRLYDKGEALPYAERHPFRTHIEEILQQTVVNQELWITKTGEYLARASTRFRARYMGQTAITSFFKQQN